MAEFKEGDVVQLKSGGPEMTVFSVDSQLNLVACKWFVGSDARQQSFSPALLDRVEETDE